MQAMQAMAVKAGASWVVPIIAALVTLNVLGGIGGWFASTARLPFVAGLDRYLPEAFGRLHPRWKTPYVALLAQNIDDPERREAFVEEAKACIKL